MPRRSVVQRNRLWGQQARRVTISATQTTYPVTATAGSGVQTPILVTIVAESETQGAGALSVGTPSAAWLTAAVVDNRTVSLTVDVTGLPAGADSATVTVTGALAENVLTFTVNLQVNAAATAQLTVARTADDRSGDVGGANPAPLSVSVYSSNAVSLAGPTVTSQTYSAGASGWCTYSAAQLAAGSLNTSLDISGIQAAGTYTCTFTLSDAAAGNTQTYVVYLKLGLATSPAFLAVSPSSVNQTGSVGGAVSNRTVTISNLGSGGLAALGTITAQILGAPAWASVSYSSGTATISYTTTGLDPSTVYQDTLRITASTAQGSPVDVPLTLTTLASSQVPLLRWASPNGVTQNATTGEITGVPTGITVGVPAHATGTADFVCTTRAQLATALASQASMNNPVIEIPAGYANRISATDAQKFVLPVRTGSGPCVIRTANYASLPASGTRMSPADEPNCAWLECLGENEIIDCADGANDYYFLGILTTDTGRAARNALGLQNLNFGHVRLEPDSSAVIGQATAPRRITFDRCVGKGHVNDWSGRWMVVRAFNCQWRDCYGYNYKALNNELQCILIPDQGGGHYLDNCHLEAAGENFFIGGSPLTQNNLEYLPRDIYVKRCRMQGRIEWFSFQGTNPAYGGVDYGFKNLVEVKRVERILFDGCVFDTGGKDGQQGLCVVVKSEDNWNGGNPGQRVSVTLDVQFIDCLVINTQRSFALLGNSQPSIGGQPTQRVHVLNCLCIQQNVPPNSGAGYHIEITNRIRDVVVQHVTIAQAPGINPDGCVLTFNTCTNVEVVDNIFPQGNFGFKGDTVGQGTPSINLWTNPTVTRNALFGGSTSTNYPAGNFFPASEAAVGFVAAGSAAVEDYALGPGSPYLTSSALGGPLGCDVGKLAARIAGV